MAKLSKAEKAEYKALKKAFKVMFPRFLDKYWDYGYGIIDSSKAIILNWTPFPNANALYCVTLCSAKDEYNEKRGKLEVLRKIVNKKIWLPQM